MSGSGSVGPLEVAVEPRNPDYDDDDERWRDQVGTLYSELRLHVDTVQRARQIEGAKGTLDELIVALGSAGVFTAAVSCFRAWLQRDRSRRLDVRWEENGVEHFVTLTGDAIDAETVRTVAQAAASRVGESAWPVVTEPS